MSYAAKLTKCEAEVARLTAEIAAMRERCGRLAASVLAWREYDQTFSTLVGVTEINRMLRDTDFYRLSGLVCEAMQRVKDHNDLTPPKETSDGH